MPTGYHFENLLTCCLFGFIEKFMSLSGENTSSLFLHFFPFSLLGVCSSFPSELVKTNEDEPSLELKFWVLPRQ